VASERAAQGGKTLVFRETKPLPSYLVAFATGPLETAPIAGLSVPGRVVTVKGKKARAHVRPPGRALRPGDMNLPGYGFHPLKGDRKGEYAVSISGMEDDLPLRG
jgi:hypothetical protein